MSQDWNWISKIPDAETGFEQYRLSQNEVTIDFQRQARLLLQMLNETDQPIISHSIETEFKMPGADVRKLVRWLRFKKHPVCSGKTGYYLAKNPEELFPTIKHMIDRARADMAIALSLEEARQSMIKVKEQRELFEQNVLNAKTQEIST